MIDRTKQYLRYLIYKGAKERYGDLWFLEPERQKRIDHELRVIEKAGFSSYFIILASIVDFCRREKIPYGPGRGSVGGCYVAYLTGIHEVDPLEWGLIFERFLTEDRVSYPDVDLDFSQIHRPRIIEFIQQTYSQRGAVVLQVGAFRRAGGRGTIDAVLAAMRQVDENADQTAYVLRSYLPEGNITGGTKQARELSWWLDNGHGNRDDFRILAEKAGWLEPMQKIDGMFTGISTHAAGIVILQPEDVPQMPQCSPDGHNMVTGFDMYDLDDLGALKIDILGLRTLDVISEAHRNTGGSGSTDDLMELWREHRDDPGPYEMLSLGETTGVFQMETYGYRHTLRKFKPDRFDHIVQLNALYRPGALDYHRDEDGKNMVEVFIDRRHHKEPPTPPAEELRDLLSETYGIFLYQEQAMQAVRTLANFDGKQADTLRKGIGKKIQSVIDSLHADYLAGCEQNGIQPQIANRVWENIKAAARYSWNKAHAVEYAIITWLTAWFKWRHPAAFYSALMNSYSKKGADADRLADCIAEARSQAEIEPPDINIAEAGFVNQDNRIIFGLGGIKGVGEANRGQILLDRMLNGPYKDFTDFCTRLPSLPMDKKLALIRCGAFDQIEDRRILLATCIKPGKAEKIWTVAEHINHNRRLKKPRPVPPIWELTLPKDSELSKGELETTGFYISTAPLQKVEQALRRVPSGTHFGGEIERLVRKVDRNGNDYLNLTLLTPQLTKQLVRVFHSVLVHCSWIEKGQQIVVRGKMDGSAVLANGVFEAGDYRHFRRIRISKADTPPTTEDFDGRVETIDELEAAGYTVHLL